jgi:hypothetical protein
MRFPLVRRKTADAERRTALARAQETFDTGLALANRRAGRAEARLVEWGREQVERFEAYPDYARDARQINVLISNTAMHYLQRNNDAAAMAENIGRAVTVELFKLMASE